MATAAARPQAVEIPNKLYFRIGDVSRLTAIKSYVLRYWETEFPTLSPKKSGTNQRLYRRKDVEMVLEIKHLLYEKRYTIEGARTFLHGRRGEKKAAAPPVAASQSSLFGPDPAETARVEKTAKAAVAGMAAVRRELGSILELLGS
ncbi:MAG: MerR family transcriptional regulator [Candidatus Solibacter usitatus]|nr:MerR family transcriptional regulator [Candidatus Solibacter usitatus]